MDLARSGLWARPSRSAHSLGVHGRRKEVRSSALQDQFKLSARSSSLPGRRLCQVVGRSSHMWLEVQVRRSRSARPAPPASSGSQTQQLLEARQLVMKTINHANHARPCSRTRRSRKQDGNDRRGDRIGHMSHTVAQSYLYPVASSCVRLIAARSLLVVRPHTSLRPAQTPRTRRDDAHAGFRATLASVRCGPHWRSESIRTPGPGGMVGLLR